jgi:hypothetical protein
LSISKNLPAMTPYEGFSVLRIPLIAAGLHWRLGRRTRVGCSEFGTVSLTELAEHRDRLGLGTGRDLHFTARGPISRYIEAASKAGCIVEDSRAQRDRCAHAAILSPGEEAVESGQRLKPQIQLALIDSLLEEVDFGGLIDLVNADVPGPRPAVGTVAPAIATTLELVLELEGRVFGPGPDGLAPGPLQENVQDRAIDMGQGKCEDLE